MAGGQGATAWTGRQVKVDFSAETVVAMGSFRLAPYKVTVGAWLEVSAVRPPPHADDRYTGRAGAQPTRHGRA